MAGILVFCSFQLSGNLSAQSVWLAPTNRSFVAVELYRLDKSSQFSGNGTTVFINGRLKTSDELTFVFDIPIARSDELDRFGFFGSFAQSSQTMLGNPYIGISYMEDDHSATTIDAGMRVPIAEKDKPFAAVAGIQADYTRFEAFTSDPISLSLLVGNDWSSDTNPHNGWIKGGVSFIVPNVGDDIELIANVQSGIWYRGETVTFGFNLIGRSLITEGDLSLSQKTEVLFGFGFTANFDSLRPGVHGRVPAYDNGLSDLGDRINSSFGFSLSVLIGEE